MKKSVILAVTLLTLVFFLSSCSVLDRIKENRAETTAIDTTAPVTESPQTTIPETTETETTVPETTVSETSAPDTTVSETSAPPVTEAPVTASPEILPPVDTDFYAVMDNPVGRSIGFVPSLTESGNSVQYQHIPSASDFGTVLSVAYEGFEQDGKIFIKNGTPVTFTVSRGKLPDLSGRVVYLTFDDGPNLRNTTRIVETLNRRGIRATFFQVGSYINAYPSMTKLVYDSGNVLGCHTYDHDYNRIYSTEENFTSEIRQWENAAAGAVGKVPEERVFRFPGGSRKRLFADTLSSLGYRGFDWSALNNDCLLKNCPADMTRLEYVKTSVISTLAYSFSIKAPHIILMHETYSETADMLDFLIDYLSSLGCLFSTCDNLTESWYY